MIKIIIWEKFNRLTIIKEIEKRGKYRFVRCQCICWNLTDISLSQLRHWGIKSCWCQKREVLLKRNTSHWMRYTRVHRIWSNMKNRCNNSNSNDYHRYWWRWITYDFKWEKFEWFYEDMKEWYDKWLKLDRRENNWNYSKKNCRWVQHKMNCINKSNNVIFKWECISDISRRLWWSRSLVSVRLSLWWDLKTACTTPLMRKRAIN